MRLPPLPTVRDLVKLYKLRALRQLSQNFLLDARIIERIVKAAGGLRGGEVCEVGPGPGGITRAIIGKEPHTLLLVEKDARFLPALQMLEDAARGSTVVKVIQGDVLSFNMAEVFRKEEGRGWAEPPPNIHLIGNLPFNIATPLIVRWLKQISLRESAWRYGRVRMTLTFQKEVAERLVAPILSSQRCRLSVMAQNWCHISHKFNIPGSAFVPKPAVDVGVVHFVPLLRPVIDLPFTLVERVVRSLFHFRQKYSIRGIETLLPAGCRERLAPELMRAAEVDQTCRPLQLTLPEIGRLCHAYDRLVRTTPSLAQYNYRQGKSAQLSTSDVL